MEVGTHPEITERMMRMYGAMIGDFVGSIYEWRNIKTKEFPFFHKRCFLTDDSYMTVAVAQACMNWPEHRSEEAFVEDLTFEMVRIGRTYPDAGYGGRFSKWLFAKTQHPYKSCGNGSAMRASPCGMVAESLEEAELLGRLSALPSHDHREGIRGAVVTAGCVYLAKTGATRHEISRYIKKHGYDMRFTLNAIRPMYKFNETCQGTVPPALKAFLESYSFEDAIRNAISLGGDSDTVAAITGGVAGAYYGIPDSFLSVIRGAVLAQCLREEQDIIHRFTSKFDENGKQARTNRRKGSDF